MDLKYSGTARTAIVRKNILGSICLKAISMLVSYALVPLTLGFLSSDIGKHVTIGANAVVTHSIPSYCVAVGCPAYIIKRYNFEIQKWQKTDKNGNFIMS